MTPTEAIILGILQGVTEPLPVSSSAHLVIVPALIPGFHQPTVFFDVVLHLGTLIAVLFFLRLEIIGILASLLPENWQTGIFPSVKAEERTADRRLALLITIATLLTAVIGLLFKDRIERLFESVETTAVMLLITGVLLFLSDRVKNAKRTKGEMNLMDGVVIGLVQAIALIPGISRSGSTITFGIYRRLERGTAARFSFLLSIPAIAGAAILKMGDIAKIASGDLAALGIGFLTAAVTGFFALKFLFAMINRTGLGIFAYYCWFAGIAALIVRSMG
jgi:undecaprenyl-diphosphatase